ncbi:G-protein coupled receptor-associated sorting protein 1 [Nannospalax galili]|uniref:G protein-coupled receptor associated sorting protein 1 n=1 Tax=Nannospalax galili TaxID=1026970 RepID=A0A8C6R0H4_NANGA|nr:G-protein coupled receptor-associated sorting protein 1 [Nannospalax galili]XP_017650786.1 G-protein coupled receptor-associated sorting protein 1 [Nannospalax galili]XP_017650787.1 G-protein coupled receptor-associated sorting protein 1 [Nannospalax galili]XP_017650788.1 G-protein coupled receptor-associated sorting protein 1 [Nannospalax galili]XP_017650789.1 G-protein coupled receptor-associated sorting protein 1 [Nannospalax galili]XP_029413924.1 G-protein coupled receptor-associated so
MTGAEIEPGVQAKTGNKPGDENSNAAERENAIPLVVRPKVRTQLMPGARPKMKSKGTSGARSKSEPSTVGGAHANGKTKASSSSRSKSDAQAWGQNKFRGESMSKMGKQCQTKAVDSPLVSADSGAVPNAKCLYVDRESVHMDTERFPKKATSQGRFQPSFGSEEVTSIGPWYCPRPIPKEEVYENSDFKWGDKPSGGSWFWNRDEINTRFRPRKSMKVSSRSRHMAKQEANTMSRHKNKQEFYIISSSDSEDESVKTSWFWTKEKTNIWSRSREEPNNRSWFRSKKDVCMESSSESECESRMKSCFWSGEEAKPRSKPRVRKGANVRARHQAKRDAYSDVMSGAIDINQKEAYFWPEEKTGTFLRSKPKKDTRVRAMAKEEVKSKPGASTKQESRTEEEVLIGSWFWDTEESSPHVEDETIVGNWFWTEEASAVTGASHKPRLRVKEKQIDSFCLRTEKKISMEVGAKAASKSMLVANDDEVIVGSWFWADDEDSKLQAEEETIFGPWFWGIGDSNVRSVGVTCESISRSEEKSITDSWFWTGEVNTEIEEQTRPASAKGTIFVPWFWSEKQAHMDSGTEACCDIMAGAEEEEPIIGPWFWSKVDTGVEAEVNSKSSLEDEEEPIISPWFGAREQVSMKCAIGARCKLMAEVEDTSKRSCFWAEQQPCMYPLRRERLKPTLGQDEDTVDSCLWSSNYTRPEALVGSWLWAAEEGNIDDETGEEIKIPTLKDSMFKSWFWKENEEAIIKTIDRKESKPEAEEEDIIGSWFWAGEEDKHKTPGELKEENKKIAAKEEASVASWFWGKEEAVRETGVCSKYSLKADEEAIVGSWFWEEETSLGAMGRDTFESNHGIKEEEVIGSWFWTEEANLESGSQADENRSETEDDAIFEAILWAAKNDNIEARAHCVSKPEDDDEMIVESWFWSSDKTIEESKTVTTCESKPENEEGLVVEFESGVKDEMNSTGSGENCDLSTEAETIVGSWFWAGDEAHFESDPIPVYRAICESTSSTEQEPDPSRRPQSWDEVTVQFKAGPWGKAGFPFINPFRFPKETASLFAEMFGGKLKHMGLGPDGEGQLPLRHSEDEFPFQYDPSYRSVQEIREHLKARESAQSESWSCKCIQCDLRIGPEEFEELLLLMDRNRDPFIHEISKIAMGMRSASQFTRDFIRNSGVVSLIEALLNYPSSRVRTQFLDNMVRMAPPYPDLNMIQTYVCQVCEDTLDYNLNSSEQLAGLMMVRHLTTTTSYHELVATYITGFLYLLATGNGKTKFHVLKMLLNLSENLVMTKVLLRAEAVSEFMGLLNKKEREDNVQIVFEIFENIGNHLKKEEMFTDDDDDDDDDDDCNYEALVSTFREFEKFAKKMQNKTDNQNHPEAE